MKLIIVESPTKARSIQKFLGSDYKILSSFGHIRDLPKSKLGLDVEKDFKPDYVIPTKARKTVNLLKKEAEKAELVILAADPDREGEAIAWHIAQTLGLSECKNKNEKCKRYERITFHEITESAIKEALKKPGTIDLNLVDAQQARRILDRLVGYKLSPFLWKKVARGLSAGRVQSTAVRLVIDKEREIGKFIPQEYWSIVASLLKIPNSEFEAILIKKGEETIEKLGIKNKEEGDKILQELEGDEYGVEKITKKETLKNPFPPFTTSSLQQEAWRKFHFSAKQTMRTAQSLYEKGLITYHRTDSLNLSEASLFAAKDFILKNYGEKYWVGFLKKYKTKGNAQEAHEAIRPTKPDFIPRTSDKQSAFEDAHQERLYEMIWQRFIASQMASAIFYQTSIDIKTRKSEYTFRANGQILKFDGFLKVYPTKFEENTLPEMEEKEVLDLKKISALQHFTQPPARYSEASLIKAMEENGIGRPSTYAPTLSTIQARNYVEKNEQKRFQPTEIGFVVNDLLVKHFPEIVDINFTAEMEKKLDQIADNKEEWVPTIRNFYDPFAKNLKNKYEEISDKKTVEETTDRKCPKCGSKITIKLGRFGKFYACSNFPTCKFTESLAKDDFKVKCPKCENGNVTAKRTRKGKIFYGCNNYPKCDFALWDKPTGEKCPQCQSLLIETKGKKIKCSNKTCDYKVEVEKQIKIG